MLNRTGWRDESRHGTVTSRTTDDVIAPRAYLVRDRLLRSAYRTAVAFTFALILAPLVIIVISSFSDKLFFAFPPDGISTIAYERFLNSPPLINGLVNSAQIAALTMVVSLLVAAPAAYAIDRFRFPGRRIAEAILMAPLMLPQLLLAVAILIFLTEVRVPRSIEVLVAAHVLIATPFALRVLLTALAGFDKTLEEASASLGGSAYQTLKRVTLPVLQPGILSAAVLAFVISFGNITVSVFLAGSKSQTLPVVMWSAAEFGADSALTAVSVIVILVSVLIVAIVEKTTGIERVL